MPPISDYWLEGLHAIAIESASALPADKVQLRVALIRSLGRAGKLARATAQLQVSVDWIAQTVGTSCERAIWAAEEMRSFVELADQASEPGLRETLRRATLTFIVAARNDVRAVPWLAAKLAQIARAMGEEETIRWLEKLDGEARLALDFDRLERLKGQNDPAWEQLFDSLEERSAALDAAGHLRACDSFLRAELPRAASRHWEETTATCTPGSWGLSGAQIFSASTKAPSSRCDAVG